MRKTRAKTTCQGPCGRSLLPGEFAANAHLVGGRNPWCDTCRAGCATASDRERYKISYQRSYQAKRRADAGPAKQRWKVRVPRGWCVVTVHAHGRVDARCSWGLKMHAVSLLESLGCEGVEVHGRGGGRGKRRGHARALVRGQCEAAEAMVGLGRLVKDGLAQDANREDVNK